MIISFQPVLLEVPWGAPGRKAWRYSRSAGKVREVGHVDGGWEQQQKTHSFPHPSLCGSGGVCEHVCAWEVCMCLCMCVCVGGANRIPRPCHCLGFLKVTMCLETPLPVLPLWCNITTTATTTSSDSLHSQGPPQAQSLSHILSEPQSQPPGHAGCKPNSWRRNMRFLVPTAVGLEFTPSGRQTPKPLLARHRDTMAEGVYWVLMVERWSGPSARKGLKSHTGWEICTKEFTCSVSSAAGPVGLRVQLTSAVAQLPST